MRPIEPLPLHHSWPLSEMREHLSPVTLDPRHAGDELALAAHGLGLWHCDLRTEHLSWTAGVHALFGLNPRGTVTRPQSLALYAPDSRIAMEKLRAHAIRHRRGFTLDVDICPTGGAGCAMRLIAVPVLDKGRVVALRGIKQRLKPVPAHPFQHNPRLFDTA